MPVVERLIEKAKLRWQKMNANCIGKNVHILRNMCKLTQEELGKQVSLSASAISNIENSLSHPSIDTLIKLAECFNVSVDYLLNSGDKELEELQIKEKLQTAEKYLACGGKQRLEILHRNKKYFLEEDDGHLLYEVISIK